MVQPNNELELPQDTLPAAEQQSTNKDGDERHFLTDCAQAFLKRSQVELHRTEPVPKKKHKFDIKDYTTPSMFDIGIFRYTEDLSESRVREYYDLQDVSNIDEVETLILRSLINLMESTYALLLSTNRITRKSLNHASLPYRNEVIASPDVLFPDGRGFSEIMPDTLSRYTEIGLHIVLSLVRLSSVNGDIPLVVFARSVLDAYSHEAVDEQEKRIAGSFLHFMKQVLFDDPVEEALAITALKGLIVTRVESADEVKHRIKSKHEMSFVFAAVKYVFTGVVLNMYWGQIDANILKSTAHQSVIQPWSQSLVYNTLNSFLYKSKKLQEPGQPKCEVDLDKFIKPRIIFDANPSAAMDLEDIYESLFSVELP